VHPAVDLRVSTNRQTDKETKSEREREREKCVRLSNNKLVALGNESRV